MMSNNNSTNQEQSEKTLEDTVNTEEPATELQPGPSQSEKSGIVPTDRRQPETSQTGQYDVEPSEDAKITHISTWFKVKFSALVAWKLISHFCFRGFCFLPINRRFTTGLILTNPICDSETSAYDTSEKDENNCVLKQYTMYMYRKGNSMSWGLAIQNFLDFEIVNLSKNKWYNIKDLNFNLFNSFWKRNTTLFYSPAWFISKIPHYHFPNYDADYEMMIKDK